MTLAEEMAEDRRLIILRALQEASASQLNETILKIGVNKFGHTAGRDLVRGDLSWLEEQRLVRIDRLAIDDGDFWVAHLTTSGDEVASGRRHPGVAKRFK